MNEINLSDINSEANSDEFSFDMLFNKMSQGVIYQDYQGYIIKVNSAAERLFGIPSAEMIGKSSIIANFKVIDESGKLLNESELPSIVALTTGIPVENVILGVFHPQYRDYFWIQVSAEPEFKPGETTPFRVFTTFNDISKRINIEKKLYAQKDYIDSIVAAIPDLMFIISNNGVFLEVKSGEAEELMLPPDLFLGKNISEIFPPELTKVFLDAIKKTTLENEVISIEYELPYNDRLSWYEARFKSFTEDKVIVLVSNIDKRKETENSLRKSERDLKIVVDSTFHWEFWEAPDGTFIFHSPSCYKVTGYTAQELLKNNNMRAKLIHPDDLQGYILHNKEVKENLCTGKHQLRIIRADGEVRHIEHFCQPVFDENNNYLGTRGTNIDITERIKTEENLRKSEESLRNLVNSQTSYVLKTDMDGKHTYFNNKFVEEFGWVYKKDELLGSDSLTSICDYHHPRAYEAVEKCVAGPGKIIKVELDKPYKDGSIRTTLWEFVCLTDNESNPTEIQCMGIDITDRIKAENELKKSQAMYQSLIDSSDAAIMMVNPEGNYIYLNKIATFPYGLMPEEMVGINVKELVPPNQATEIMANIKTVLETKMGMIIEPRVIIAGEQRWLRTSVQPVMNENGIPYAVLMYATDITEQKQAELLIKQSEEKYRTLFFDSPEAYLIIDDNKIIETNKASEELIGIEREKLLGISLFDLSAAIQPDGKTITEINEEINNNIFINGQHKFEWTFKKANNEKFLAKISLNVIEYEGINALFVSLFDITAQKKAEERVRILTRTVEQSPVSIVITNLDGNIEYANPKACETTGYSLNELIGNNPKLLKSGETSEEEYTKLWGNISNGKEWRGIFHNKRKNGEMYWESSSIAPIFDNNGKITHYMAIKEDITERKAIQENMLLNEERFRQVAELSRTVVWEIDKEGKYTYISSVVEQVFGYKPEELVGKKYFYDLHPEEVREEYKMKGFEILTQTGKILENPILTKDGRIVWVSTNGMPLYNSNGEIIGYRCADNDITERRQFQLELLESQDRFLQIARHSKTVIWEIDLNGLYTYISPASEEVWGYKPEELVGKLHFYDLHPEENRKDFVESELKFISEGKILQDFENPILHKNNHKIWVSTSGFPVYNQRNEIVGYRGADVDITDRRLAEEETRKFRIISDQANYGTAIVNLDNKLIYANPTMAKMHGYEVEELMGQSLAIFHNESQMPRVKELLDKLITKGGFTAEEVWRVRKDGSVFPSLMSAKTIFNDNGKPEFLSATIIDNTNAKEIEEALIRNEESLNYAQEIANMGSWEFDLVNNKIHWSKNYYKLVGHDPSLPPLSLEEIKKRIHPEDIHLFELKLNEIAENNKMTTLHFRLMNSDGSIKYIQSNIVPEFINNELVSVSGVSIDITEKRLKEIQIQEQNARLSAILDAMPDMIFISDRDGNYLEYFRSKRNSKLNDYQHLVGKNIRDAFDEKTSKLHLEKIEEAVQ